MNKAMAFVLGLTVLSATVFAATIHYGYFVAKNVSGYATISSTGYNSCRATITDAEGNSFFLRSGTVINDLDGSIECTGSGGIIHKDGTIEHGTASLEADSALATIEVNEQSVSTVPLKFRIV